jgi:hypothetical protein
MIRESLSRQLLFLCFWGVVAVTGCDRGESAARKKAEAPEGPQAQRIPRMEKPVRQSPVRFVDQSDASGVRFSYRDGQEAGHFAILESLGGGVSVADYDRDGWFDLAIPGGGHFGENKEVLGYAPALYRSDRGARFRDQTREACLSLPPHYNHGIAVGDYDQDGFPDLLVTGFGGLLLHHNQGDGTFVEASHEAQLTDPLWSSSAAWGDINGDGWLDLYVAHYVDWSFDNHPKCPGPSTEHPTEVCPPRKFDGLPDVLYFGRGDGTFADVSNEMGLKKDGKGLGVVLADVDLDGDLDVYVGNDTVPNFLYQNDGTGHLQEMGLMSGTSVSDKGLPDGSMGVDVADINLDGLPDIWVANYERESIALYRNEGRFFFLHVSQAMGITAVGGLYVGWGTTFFDFDHDGDEDVFVSNGHVVRFPTNSTIDQLPLLFENLAGKRFENVAPSAGDYMTTKHRGRGVAMGDLDNDGDIDLVVSRINQPVAVLRCESQSRNHWLTLQLVGTKSNRDAIGAQIRVHTSQGVRLRLTKGGGSYASSHDPRVNIGLGGDDKAQKIEIRWPSGVTQELTNVPVDQFLLIHEPSE